MSAAGQHTGRETIARNLAAAARASAFVAGVFTAVVCAMLALSVHQQRRADPLNLPELEQMRKELGARPDDAALRDRIRNLDLLARHSFFANSAFVRAGALLALIGFAATALGGAAAVALARRPPRPGPPDDDAAAAAARSKAASRRLLWVAAAGFVAAAVVAALTVRTDLTPQRAADLRKPPPVSPPAPAETPVAWTEVVRQWPSFRGPGGLGVAWWTNAPVTWNGTNDSGIIWKVPVPRPGFSSPIVWGNRIFLTGADAEAREVFAFEASSGRMLWRSAVRTADPPPDLPEVSEDTGHAASTPATDGKRVFAIFSTAELVALDFDGKLLWSHNVGPPDIPYGHASSLLTWRNLIFVQFDHRNGFASVTAYDCRTGDVVWQKKRKADPSWASPIIADPEGRAELIVAGTPLVQAYDPLAGSEVWKLDCMRNEMGPSPAWADGFVFAGHQYAELVAIREGSPAQIAWRTSDDVPDTSSPVAADGRVYFASSGGTVTCLKAADGSGLWRQDFAQGFSASPIIVGRRIYLVDKRGTTHIFAAADEFRLLATSPLGEKSVCTPAFLDGRIYMRADSSLYCVADGESDGR